MEWHARRALAGLFAVEGVWIVVRAALAVIGGAAFSSGLAFALWLLGTLLWPGSFFGAAWFLARRQPPTLLRAAVTRSVVVFVVLATNLVMLSAAASGRFTLT